MKITTLKLSEDTKSRIERLREYKKESYDEILQKTMDIISLCKVNPMRAQSRLKALQIKQMRKNKQIIVNEKLRQKEINQNKLSQVE